MRTIRIKRQGEEQDSPVHLYCRSIADLEYVIEAIRRMGDVGQDELVARLGQK